MAHGKFHGPWKFPWAALFHLGRAVNKSISEQTPMFMLSKLSVFNWERISFYKDDYKTGLYLTSVKILCMCFTWAGVVGAV